MFSINYLGGWIRVPIEFEDNSEPFFHLVLQRQS